MSAKLGNKKMWSGLKTSLCMNILQYPLTFIFTSILKWGKIQKLPLSHFFFVFISVSSREPRRGLSVLISVAQVAASNLSAGRVEHFCQTWPVSHLDVEAFVRLPVCVRHPLYCREFFFLTGPPYYISSRGREIKPSV